MKKIIYSLVLFTLLISIGCKEKTDFTLKGKITNLPSDTLLLYYQVPQYKLDTLFCKKGEFNYSFTPDTFTMFSIILNEQETLPIFAEKGKTVEFKGSLEQLQFKGEEQGENRLFHQIYKTLQDLPNDSIKKVVDSLIQANPHSFTTLYLIDKYYTRKDSVDYTQLKEYIERLHGNIKETPYMTQLLSKVKTLESKQKIRNIISVQGKHRDGKEFKWREIKNKLILLNFWASWYPESMSLRDSLKTILKEKGVSKKDFLICNISLDMDKEAWIKASDKDTIQWKHVCDFKGWNNSILNSQGIQTLPFTVLLDSNKRIISQNPSKKEVIEKVKELKDTKKPKKTKKSKK